jgi:signal transduction histidine kinase
MQALAQYPHPLTVGVPIAAATILALLALIASLLGIIHLLPFLIILAVVLSVHLLGAALIRRGQRPELINPAIRLTNLSAYTLAVMLSDGLYSPVIPLYVEDILSASVRDGRHGAWKGWGLVTAALAAVALQAWPLTVAEISRFLIYTGVTAIMAIIAGELGQQRIESLSALSQQTIENARLYAELEERARRLSAAYEELSEMDQHKTEFIQNVSHELRTPLLFIRGYIELLRDGGLGELSKLQREKLNIVARKTELLAELVRDVVSLQRGQPRPEEMSNVSLTEVTRQAVISAEAMAYELGLTISLDLPVTPLTIRADAYRLEEVFDNLLSNAIKFSPNGGTVTVRVYQKDGSVVVSVADEGVGVPPEEHERIFERFYQVDGSTTRRFEGTGLGLAIVKQIVEGHNGRVWVESPTLSGRGSTFYFSVPAVKCKA